MQANPLSRAERFKLLFNFRQILFCPPDLLLPQSLFKSSSSTLAKVKISASYGHSEQSKKQFRQINGVLP